MTSAQTSTQTRAQVSAVILSGGRSRRMDGRDKAFVEIHGRPLIERVIETLRPQVGELFISANPDDPRYRSLGSEVLPDPVGPDFGPLAGILAGLERTKSPYLLTAPCDVPFLPDTLAERLLARIKSTGARVATAADGDRLHGTISLLERGLADDLRAYIENGGRKVRDWLEENGCEAVDFSDAPNAFLNINSPDDRARAESMLPLPK
ncbi:MAG: molybdenum cofactor guanylyltransferase [Gammaproteobacteria bacterium]|nr:molybdenum cofactor guanylyltransferase [Gammaproteobacteria bacterium]